MDIAKHYKKMVLEKKCALDPTLEDRLLNDKLTVRDIAFLTRNWKSANSPETRRIARKFQSQRNGGIT